MKSKKVEPLIDRLHVVHMNMVCSCDCDGRGCTMCMGAPVILEAIKKLSEQKSESH